MAKKPWHGESVGSRSVPDHAETGTGATSDNGPGERFRRGRDWRRVVVLGLVVVHVALLGCAYLFLARFTPDYWPGSAALFGGVIMIVIVGKISAPKVYGDWILLAMIFVGLGTILTIDPHLRDGISKFSFAVFSLAISVQLNRMGAILATPVLRASFQAGAVTSFLASVLGNVACLVYRSISPDGVTLVLLSIAGFVIIGFGQSLRDRSELEPPSAGFRSSDEE
ncbi:MAG: hypothetical protein EON58_18605 [Alphaproteobacteria bacterium]|nr:MAG: hypothetical protein EON58_18605 [Alphaproteobacteria bacterium]